MAKGKSTKPPTAKQLAARARFAQMAASNRGAVGFGNPFGGSFGRTRNYISSLKSQFKGMSWGVAALSFLGGYFIPQTLAKLGVGNFLYNSVPAWAAIDDQLYAEINAVYPQGVSSWAGGNPWGDGGVIGLGKVGGVGWLGKKLYDVAKGKRLGRGALNVGIPAALGLILDGPELSPMSMGGPSYPHYGPQMVSQGGVSW